MTTEHFHADGDAFNPLLDDDALVHHLRTEAASLGMLFGTDKAVMRAALVAALPDAHRERALRLLGTDDPMFASDPGAAGAQMRISAVQAVLGGAAALLEAERARPGPAAGAGETYDAECIRMLEGMAPVRRRPR